MKKSILLLLILLLYLTSIAQIGIGNSDPDSCAYLHIGSDTAKKGFIVPVTESITVIKDSVKEEFMLFYASEQKAFMFYDGEEWQKVNPWKSLFKNDSLVIPDNIIVTNNNSDEGHKYYIQNDVGHLGVASVPIGGIIMWTGHKDSIPVNWRLCNGLGTFYDPFTGKIKQIPDLRGRFVVGYSDTARFSNDRNYPPSQYDSTIRINEAIGSENNGSFEKNSFYDSTSSIGKNHGRSRIELTKKQIPQHKHKIEFSTLENTYNIKVREIMDNKNGLYDTILKYEKTEEYKTIDDSSNTTYLPREDLHYHSINGTTEKNRYKHNNVSPHENRPPYYVLAFIIRIW
jgi:microcystin-dependent protein